MRSPEIKGNEQKRFNYWREANTFATRDYEEKIEID